MSGNYTNYFNISSNRKSIRCREYWENERLKQQAHYWNWTFQQLELMKYTYNFMDIDYNSIKVLMERERERLKLENKRLKKEALSWIKMIKQLKKY